MIPDLNNSENVPSYMKAIEHLNEIARVGIQETDLVILKSKVQIEPLTGIEEQQLKSANISITSFLKALDEILYKKIINKDALEEVGIKNYEDFLKKLTPHDKSMLILALSLSSFSTFGSMDLKCEKCEQSFPAEIKPEELWHPDSLVKTWDKEIDPFEYSETQTFLDDNIQIELELPTEYKRLAVMEILEKRGQDAINFSLIDTIAFFAKRIIIKDGLGKGKDQVLEDLKNEIFPFFDNLPTKIKDIILENVDLTIFDDYMVNLYQESQCPKCMHINKINVNIESDFFRKTISLF